MIKLFATAPKITLNLKKTISFVVFYEMGTLREVSDKGLKSNNFVYVYLKCSV